MEGLPPDTFSEVEDEVDTVVVVEEEKIQLVVFTLADECYGVDIGTVESVIKLQPITAVPQAPYFVEGLTNLRGTVLPVLDLRKRLGLPVFTPTKKSRIVVAKVGGIPAGLIVDSVDAVLRVSVGDIDPPSPINTATDSAYISGIAKLEDQLIILLDLKKVLPSV
ncbi:MAG: chemotaxis protein CheW [Anaerolineae bacterium]|nr:chemotaxis protein CheW [Anaerolineae bacterium]